MSMSSALNRETRFRRLPSVDVGVPFLETFRVGYSSEQPGLVKNCPCLMARGRNEMRSKVPSNPNHSKIL